MAKICFVSIDVEPDFGKQGFEGVENLDKILRVFEKIGIKATFFTTGEVLQKYPGKFKELSKHYEIACHSFLHTFWNQLSQEQRQKEINLFLTAYEQIFGKGARPAGFRAPSHLIDKEAIQLLEQSGFLYDSSIVPHYPFFTHYRGFQGKAPKALYYPNPADPRAPQKLTDPRAPQELTTPWGLSILEIPVAGLVGGVPVAGAWVKRLPVVFYRALFIASNPSFLTVSAHSWDVLDKRFLKKFEKILLLLKKKNYQFLFGKEIATTVATVSQ